MWEERARTTRRQVADLAAAGSGVRGLFSQAIAVVQQVVPVDLTCWAVLDPESAVISAMVNGPAAIPSVYEPHLAESEYTPGEPHTFRELAARREVVASSVDLGAAERARSRRFDAVWRPLGIDHEVRVVFFGADGTAWGSAGMVRAHGGFAARELEYLAAVAPALATATRLAVRTEVVVRPRSPGPAVVVLGPDGGVRSMTAGAGEWRDRFDDLAPGRFVAVLQLMRTGMTSSRSGDFEALLRDGTGGWAVLRATPLIGEGGEGTAVTIDAADPAALLGPALRAFGLTSRERAVCEQVLAGRSTASIAEALFISEHTVQDHLKSVFAKTGVRSRRELVSVLRSAGAPAA